MSYLDWTTLDEQVEKSLSKYYPNYSFKQVAENLNEVEAVKELKRLTSEKKFLGFSYAKQYNYDQYKETVYFTQEIIMKPVLYNEEFTIAYGISNKLKTVYWKLVDHKKRIR